MAEGDMEGMRSNFIASWGEYSNIRDECGKLRGLAESVPSFYVWSSAGRGN
jgi:hypothetical protein